MCIEYIIIYCGNSLLVTSSIFLRYPLLLQAMAVSSHYLATTVRQWQSHIHVAAFAWRNGRQMLHHPHNRTLSFAHVQRLGPWHKMVGSSHKRGHVCAVSSSDATYSSFDIRRVEAYTEKVRITWIMYVRDYVCSPPVMLNCRHCSTTEHYKHLQRVLKHLTVGCIIPVQCDYLTCLPVQPRGGRSSCCSCITR